MCTAPPPTTTFCQGSSSVPWTWRRATRTRGDVERHRAMLDAAVRAMRSPEFKDVFPAEHVARWENRYRLLVLKDLDLVRDEVLPRELPAVRDAFIELAAAHGGPLQKAVA